ncbi:hypothetical protein SDJN03_14586, partial [Cucurbita argyrosperma subsp. sororia]
MRLGLWPRPSKAGSLDSREFQNCRDSSTCINMSLACLVCNSVDSPSHSLRSYSVSSSDNEGRCSAIANCLIWRPSFPPTHHHHHHHPSYVASAKVTPQPTISNSNVMDGTPRLVRSRAVRRDLVQDWNFDEVVVVQH